MSAAWDGSPALSPVPRGERSGEAFNSVPGDQQLQRLFGVHDRRELLIIGAGVREEEMNGPSSAASQTDRASVEGRRGSGRRAGLLIAGALYRSPVTHGGPRSRAAIISRASCSAERGLVVGAQRPRITSSASGGLAVILVTVRDSSCSFRGCLAHGALDDGKQSRRRAAWNCWNESVHLRPRGVDEVGGPTPW
jgi:hypothetical protein